MQPLVGRAKRSVPHWHPAPPDSSPLEPFRIWQHRAKILDAVSSHRVTLIHGDSGTGKTSQVPPMLAGSGILPEASRLVLCSQPYHLPCLGMAEFVCSSWESELAKHVAAETSFTSAAVDDAQVLYCTAEVVLRRLRQDPTLAGVGCLIIDEVQEREMYTDLLLAAVRDALRSAPEATWRVVVMGTDGSVSAESWRLAGCGDRPPLEPAVVGVPQVVQMRCFHLLCHYFRSTNFALGRNRPLPQLLLPCNDS